MNKIKIMESSVAKWNRIIEGKSSDGGVLDCQRFTVLSASGWLLICEIL